MAQTQTALRAPCHHLIDHSISTQEPQQSHPNPKFFLLLGLWYPLPDGVSSLGPVEDAARAKAELVSAYIVRIHVVYIHTCIHSFI